MPTSQPLFSNRALRKLIVPLILEQLLAMTVGVADTVMLTTVGEAAVSGVSLVDVINNLIIQVLAALATGGAVICSQYLGRQDDAHARDAARQLLYAAVAFSVVISSLMLTFRSGLLALIFGAVEPEVMDKALIYFLLTGLSFPFLAVYNACAAMFRSMGNSRISLFASILMNIINIGGNAILIYGCGWGPAGAGTATLFSRAAAAVLMLVLVRDRRNPIWLTQVWKVRLDAQMIRRILRVGIPTGLENGMFHFGKLAVQTLIAGLGTAAIAANAIASSLGGIVIVPGSAMSLAIVTVVGQCLGANDIAQAKLYLGKLMRIAYCCMVAFNLPLLLATGPIVGLFRLGPQAAATAKALLPLMGLMHMTLWPMAFSFPNALRAAGDARYTMTVSVLSMWLVRVGLCYLLVTGFGLGVQGVFYAMYCDWVVRILFFVPRYLGGKWQQKSVLG